MLKSVKMLINCWNLLITPTKIKKDEPKFVFKEIAYFFYKNYFLKCLSRAFSNLLNSKSIRASFKMMFLFVIAIVEQIYWIEFRDKNECWFQWSTHRSAGTKLHSAQLSYRQNVPNGTKKKCNQSCLLTVKIFLLGNVVK